MDKAKAGKATCLRVSVFKRLGGKTITKGQDKGLKVLQARNRKKGGRKVVYKEKNGSYKTRHYPSTLKIFKHMLTY